MTASLQAAPAYVDSGLPWLGAIPAHREVRSDIEALERETEGLLDEVLVVGKTL